MDMHEKSKTAVDMAPLLKRCSHPSKDCKENLFLAWEDRDHYRFKDALTSKNMDLGHCYEDHGALRIADLTAKAIDGADYLQSIIATGCNVNEINPSTGRVPAHYAAEVGNISTLTILLNNGADMNVQDPDENTPLHTLIMRWDHGLPNFEQCLDLLLGNSHVTVNVPNKKGLTPISLAAAASEAEVVAEFLRLGASLDLDTFRSTDDNKTSREIILKNFPGLEDELPDGPWEPDPDKGILDYKFRLFYYLKTGQEIKFCQTFRDIKVDRSALLTCYDGQRYTYLQHTAEQGYSKAIKTLINAGADANLAHLGTAPPIVLATQNGKCEAVNTLLNVPDIDLTADSSGETLLHNVVRGQGKTFGHFQILRRLVRHPKIEINGKDTKGRTALHYAAMSADEKTIFFLLDNGANLYTPNNFGETPLDQMTGSSLRKYLDSKISTNKALPKHGDFAYIFDYKFASSKKKGSHIYGTNTDLLSKLASNPELRVLLSHPVYSTIILFKWQRIRLFFYLDLFFYTLFCIFLTSYLIFGPTLLDIAECNSTTVYNSTNSTDMTYLPCDNSPRYVLTIEIFLLLFVATLATSETFQFIGAPVQYFFSIENWLQIGVVVTSVASILLGCPKYHMRPSCNDLNAFAVFFAWFEFFFVVGKHPKLTFYVDMFRTASSFLLRFLIVHTSLVLAFAFSFFILFRDFESPFTTVPASVFKTIVMITGEFEVGEIPLASVPVSGHILFSCFLFLVAIVLFNLLIGLAVSATRPIEDDAFLYSCIAQVPIISFFEEMFFNDSHFCKRLLSKILSCARQQEYTDDRPTLMVYPNQKNRMEIRCQGTEDAEDEIIKISYHMTKKIVSDTQYIVTNRQDAQEIKCDKFEEIKNQIDVTQNSLEEEMKTLKAGLMEILEKLEGRNIDEVDGQAKKRRGAKADVVMRKLRSYGMKREQRQHRFTRQEEENMKAMMSQ